ncbi:MAG TPA: nitroreductase family protein [Miltoncostaeaceae bacterium]|nr:nitroreductase family protein [Miltoncostaeaceae bacterium]
MSISAADIPDVPTLQAIGNRRSIRYYDPERTVEDWKIQTILQAGRLASCQGNINATEAIVVTKDSDLWDEIEECVSGFNVQIINQSSHLIFWLTNLNAWYGRANDGLSTLALSGALTKYHGWNYEFTMTQTVPRLMSFPTERTEMLLRFESGLAVSQAMLAATSLGVGNILIAFGRKPGGVEKAFGLPPHYKFTWGHALGYPLEDPKGGGQRVRLKFEKLFHKGAYGTPYMPDPQVDEALKEKGMIQEQAPLPGRFEEIDELASKFSRDPGVVSWPEREIKRLINDEDWDFGPRIKERAQEVLEHENLPDYPEEMRDTFRKLMEEHNLDVKKYLGE